MRRESTVRRLAVVFLTGALLIILMAYGSGSLQASQTATRTEGQASSQAMVKVAKSRKLGKILVNGRGMTLYYLTSETHGKVACTGACARIWPPLLLSSGQMHPVAGKGVGGKLSTVKRPGGGMQVTYDGKPLYTYRLDTKPGQTKGQGVKGVWYVVHPSSGGSSPGW